MTNGEKKRKKKKTRQKRKEKGKKIKASLFAGPKPPPLFPPKYLSCKPSDKEKQNNLRSRCRHLLTPVLMESPAQICSQQNVSGAPRQKQRCGNDQSRWWAVLQRNTNDCYGRLTFISRFLLLLKKYHPNRDYVLFKLVWNSGNLGYTGRAVRSHFVYWACVVFRFQTGLHLLQLFGRMLQRCFAERLQKCFVDCEPSLFPSAKWSVDDDFKKTPESSYFFKNWHTFPTKKNNNIYSHIHIYSLEVIFYEYKVLVICAFQ